MRVYILHFEATGDLTRAFDRVLECPDVASCMIEAEKGRLRFLAPAGAADSLVERIYQERGLTWCSRHDVVAQAAAIAGATV
jgi:hypothetical protein